MNFYKRFAFGLFVFCLIFARGPSAFAQQQQLPHFFPKGVVETSDPATQWQEWLRYYNAAAQKLAYGFGNWPGFVIGNSIVIEKTYFGQKTKLVFDNYIREGNKIRYTFFGEQDYISEEQFNFVVDMLDRSIRTAVESNYSFWGDLEKGAIAEAVKASGQTEVEFRASLDKKDPINLDITFREMRHIPVKIEKGDFVPFREIHLGLTPEYTSVLGVTWLNTGIVYYTPVAMLRDYMMPGQRGVLAHEFVHANKKLQSIPLVWGFEADTFASIPEMLVEGNHLDVWFHGYAEDFREFIWVYSGFDFTQAREEVVKRNLMGNLEVDAKKFNEYSQKLNVVKKEFLPAFQKAIQKFYSDPIAWTALNDKTKDDNFVLKVVMASMYNPTLLGGEAPSVKWLKSNEPKINRMFDTAWEESGKPQGEQGSDEHRLSASMLMLNLVKDKYGITDSDVQKFLKLHKVSSVNDLMKWEPARLRAAVEDFIRREKVRRGIQ